jgi:outer membrane protein OmpA-like peptidoglycan-associated protein/tetratricopeptide (TPR) repeat protein
MMKFIRISLMLLTATIAVNSNAQLKLADKYYRELSYSQAIPVYDLSLRRDSSNTEAWSRFGDCYRLMSNFTGAENAYAVACKNANVSPQTMLYYAEALMANQKYDQAKVWLNKAKAANPSDTRPDQLLNGISNISSFTQAAGATIIKAVDFNTNNGEFCPVVFNGGLVFTSNRPSLRWVGSRHSWTGKDYYNLYFAKGTEGTFGLVEAFAADLSTKYHNGPAAMDVSGTTLFYTSNNVQGGKRTKDEQGITRMKIFMAKWDGGKFDGAVSLPFNADSYSVQHPSLSMDGKILYFASDMPGGQGGMDIWMSAWNGTGWDTPTNAGSKVNTKGNEAFPYIAKDGVLYYSSNGLPGLGGMDVYMSDLQGGASKNMGAPINSSSDDFGMTFLADGMSGYFSSNRGGKGDNDDIYYFKKNCIESTVTVVDNATGAPLANAELKILENGSEKETVFTDENGQFKRCLIPTGLYEFRASKDLYNPGQARINGADLLSNPESGNVKISLQSTKITLSGRVFLADTKMGIEGQKVTLRNVNSGAIVETTTDANGKFTFDNLEREALYEALATRENCGEDREQVSTVGVRGDKVFNLDMPFYCKGAVFKIDNIYYDYNKSDIRPDAARELDKLVALMTKYPNMKIELGSHTDARGKDASNQNLSDRRAKSAVTYINSKGIEASRMKSKGYGEKVILNKCKNDVECTDAEHEVNRRTEFKILSVE